MTKPWTREEFEEKLRQKGKGYHIYHPFHVMMYEGKLSKEQLQSWGSGRYFKHGTRYPCCQSSNPLQDAG